MREDQMSKLDRALVTSASSCDTECLEGYQVPIRTHAWEIYVGYI